MIATSGSAFVTLDRPEGQAAGVLGKKGGLARWGITLAGVQSETGGNVGSNFSIDRCNDAGAYVDSPVQILRNDGSITMNGNGFKVPNLAPAAASANVNWWNTNGQLFYTTSSLRFKRDIEDMEPASSARIYDLRPVWYRSTCEADRPEWSWYGFIAEEVDKIDRRFVTYKSEAGELIPDGLQYERLVVPIIAELKRLRERVAALEAR